MPVLRGIPPPLWPSALSDLLNIHSPTSPQVHKMFAAPSPAVSTVTAMERMNEGVSAHEGVPGPPLSAWRDSLHTRLSRPLPSPASSSSSAKTPSAQPSHLVFSGLCKCKVLALTSSPPPLWLWGEIALNPSLPGLFLCLILPQESGTPKPRASIHPQRKAQSSHCPWLTLQTLTWGHWLISDNISVDQTIQHV